MIQAVYLNGAKTRCLSRGVTKIGPLPLGSRISASSSNGMHNVDPSVRCHGPGSWITMFRPSRIAISNRSPCAFVKLPWTKRGHKYRAEYLGLPFVPPDKITGPVAKTTNITTITTSKPAHHATVMLSGLGFSGCKKSSDSLHVPLLFVKKRGIIPKGR